MNGYRNRLACLGTLLLFVFGSIGPAQELEAVLTDDNGNTFIVTDDGKTEVIAAENEDKAKEDEPAAKVEAADDAITVAVPVREVVADAVEVAVEAQAEGDGIFVQAVEGMLQVFGGGRAGALVRPKQASPDALTKNVDEIDSLEELRKLEKELKADQNINQMHQRFSQSINAYRDIEVHFLHLACDLKKSEFKKIQKAVELESIRCVIRQCQTYGQQFRPVRRRDRLKAKKIKTPSQQFAAAIREAARDLGKKRFEAYEKELAARDEFRKEAIAGMLVTGLDQMFHFDLEQRDEMKQVMLDNWQETWTLQTSYFSNIEYMSGLPQTEIKKVLTDKQKEIYRSITWSPQNANQHVWNQQIDMFGFARLRGRGVALERQIQFAPE